MECRLAPPPVRTASGMSVHILRSLRNRAPCLGNSSANACNMSLRQNTPSSETGCCSSGNSGREKRTFLKITVRLPRRPSRQHRLPTGLSASLFRILFVVFDHLRNHFFNGTVDNIVGNRIDRGIFIIIDRNDNTRILHTGNVLDLSGDTTCNI